MLQYKFLLIVNLEQILSYGDMCKNIFGCHFMLCKLDFYDFSPPNFGHLQYL